MSQLNPASKTLLIIASENLYAHTMRRALPPKLHFDGRLQSVLTMMCNHFVHRPVLHSLAHGVHRLFVRDTTEYVSPPPHLSTEADTVPETLCSAASSTVPDVQAEFEEPSAVRFLAPEQLAVHASLSETQSIASSSRNPQVQRDQASALSACQLHGCRYQGILMRSTS
jgi:hypothetical protein